MKTSTVTLVIQHYIVPGNRSEYEAWLKEIIPVAKSFAGHQSVDVLRPQPESDRYTLLLRFDTSEHLRGWVESSARIHLIARIEPILTIGEQLETTTGLEYLFAVPASNRRTPKPYKQFLVTLSAIFPLTVIVPLLCDPLFRSAPFFALPLVSKFVISVIIVFLMIYVIMPRYTKLISRWMFA